MIVDKARVGGVQRLGNGFQALPVGMDRERGLELEGSPPWLDEGVLCTGGRSAEK